MKKSIGFTLAELIATIVILAIIIIIALPKITGIVSGFKESAFKVQEETLIKAAVNYLSIGTLEHGIALNETIKLTVSDLEGYIGEVRDNTTGDPCEAYVEVTNIEGKLHYESFIDCDNYTTVGFTEEVPPVIPPTEVANPPVLATGMTPVKWDGSAWVNTTSDDPAWYSYTTVDKKWANAKTADGSFWVWIPRYIYQISSGWHSATTGVMLAQFSKGTDDNWNSASIGPINTGTTAAASNGTWTNHPGFTFGTLELTGFWVAKFEVSGSTADMNMVPGVSSINFSNIATAFTNSRNLETNSRYGWGTSGTGIDTHLIKNVEWGAVGYLTLSVYGLNSEPTIADTGTSYYTGGGSGAAYVTNLSQSTTGNVYGVYDITGNTQEYTAAYVNNGNAVLNSNGASLVAAAAKYKDVYPIGATDSRVNNYNETANFKGDAQYEFSSGTQAYTSGSLGWYGDATDYSYTSNPFWRRSGGYSVGALAGITCFTGGNGTTPFLSRVAIHPILIVDPTL